LSEKAPFPMVDQSNFNHQGWNFNFQGQPYVEPATGYTDPFPFLDFGDLATGDLLAENETPLLHGPITSGMDIFLGNDLWMDNQPFTVHDPNFCNMNISNDLNVALSYDMRPKSEFHTNSSSSGLATPLTPPESSISPAQAACKPVASLPRVPKKRRMEDYQLEFMGPEPVQAEKRRRQPYKTDRRMEVGWIRQVGACIRCKIMKTPVRSHSSLVAIFSLCLV
jgi:hypothetical protein